MSVDFFDVAADWADRKDRVMVFMRDDDGAEEGPAWWAVITMRDGRGPFQIEVKQMFINTQKLDGEKKRRETDEEFTDRVTAKIENAVREAIKARNFYKSKLLAA